VGSPHKSQEPAAHGARQCHLPASEFQTRAGEDERRTIVLYPLHVLTMGLEAGFAVAGELLFGGPKVLGKRHES
jgi:hypothetical protein